MKNINLKSFRVLTSYHLRYYAGEVNISLVIIN